jgi:hypothetical protein
MCCVNDVAANPPNHAFIRFRKWAAKAHTNRLDGAPLSRSLPPLSVYLAPSPIPSLTTPQAAYIDPSCPLLL